MNTPRVKFLSTSIVIIAVLSILPKLNERAPLTKSDITRVLLVIGVGVLWSWIRSIKPEERMRPVDWIVFDVQIILFIAMLSLAVISQLV